MLSPSTDPVQSFTSSFMALQSTSLAGTHLFSRPSLAMWENRLISDHPLLLALSSLGQSPGMRTPVSLLCMEPGT